MSPIKQLGIDEEFADTGFHKVPAMIFKIIPKKLISYSSSLKEITKLLKSYEATWRHVMTSLK
jgi:hypothetical protein